MTEPHPHAEDVVPLLRGVSHAWAFWLALTGAIALLALVPDSRARFAAAVYGFGLCGLFAGSALYHRWPGDPSWRPLLRRIDHSTIFVFIAASYTPPSLLILDGWVQAVVLGGRMDRCARRRDLQRRLDLGAEGARSRGIPRARLDRPGSAASACRAARPDSLVADRRRRGPVFDRRARLRPPTPRPLAAHVRIPRGLPCLRDRRRSHSLHRDGWLGDPARRGVLAVTAASKQARRSLAGSARQATPRSRLLAMTVRSSWPPTSSRRSRSSPRVARQPVVQARPAMSSPTVAF